MFMFDGFTYRDLSCQISRSPPKRSTLFDRKCVLCTQTLCDFALNWTPSKQTRQMSSSLALFLYPQASYRRTEHLGGWTTQDSARRAGANYVLCFVIGRKQQCAPMDKSGIRPRVTLQFRVGLWVGVILPCRDFDSSIYLHTNIPTVYRSPLDRYSFCVESCVYYMHVEKI